MSFSPQRISVFGRCSRRNACHSRIQLDVRAVVVEQVELDPARAGPLEEVDVHVPVVGADLLGVAVAVRVDELHAVELEERQQRRLGLGAAVDPERVADAVPGGGEALLVGVRVLDHLPLEPVRVAPDDAVADRAAVVLVVEPERVEARLRRAGPRRSRRAGRTCTRSPRACRCCRSPGSRARGRGSGRRAPGSGCGTGARRRGSRRAAAAWGSPGRRPRGRRRRGRRPRPCGG